MAKKNSPGCPCCACDPVATFIAITITNQCTGLPEPGVTVVIKSGGTSGGAVVGTTTTDGSGLASVGITQPGLYRAEVSKTNFQSTVLQNISVSCGAGSSRATSLRPTVGRIDFTLLGTCENPSLTGGALIPGATVTASQLGVVIATAVTDANGVAHFVDIPNLNTTTFAAFNPIYSSFTGTATLFATGDPCPLRTVSATVTLNAHYHCAAYNHYPGFPSGGVCLASDTLQFSGSDFGSILLTWVPARKLWVGTGTVVAGCPACGCSALSTSVEVTYGVQLEISDIGGWRDEIGWSCGVTLPPCDHPPNSCSNCGWSSSQYIIVGKTYGGIDPMPTPTGDGACGPFFAFASYQTYGLIMPSGPASRYTATVSVTDPNPP